MTELSDRAETSAADRPGTGKAIVLFADGTGNAFAKQQSNIWRLYDALDTAGPTQIAYYIPGVGTSGFRPWAVFDAATGFGVPSNVRRLYEFLCWNYEPGDRIAMFGFSRGAFTIRALIGMIDSQGLLSRTGPRGTATRPEMRRNVMSAWRAYRADGRRSLREEAPTIKITRWIRDLLLLVRDRVFGVEPYQAVRRRSDREARIRFAGLFDTVEAYGVPLEEMRDAIDWAIWPIRFHDRKLSPIVERARHALALDDERQTFHPVRFDLSDPRDRARIREVWFAGVHSDVGGGYPDDANALVPLNWMLRELAGEVAFKPDALAGMRNAASALDATHDSRSGVGNLYRYYPRPIGSREADGGPPTVHHSVIEKMVFGSTRYAPHTLPATARVLMPDGRNHFIAGFGPDLPTLPLPWAEASVAPPAASDIAACALAALQRPDEVYVNAVHDGVWLRRKAYFLLLAGLLCIASLPWTSVIVGVKPRSATGESLSSTGAVARSNDVLAAWVQDLASSVAAVTPGYAQPWVKAAVGQPLLSLALLAATALMYWANSRLKDLVDDDARCAWFGARRPGGEVPAHIPFFRGASLLRSRAPLRERRGPLYWFWYAATLAAATTCAFLYLDRLWLSYAVGSGSFCHFEAQQKPRPVEPGQPQVAEGFSPSKPCWDSGLFLEKGRAYALTLEMDITQPFLDRSLVVDIGGFQDSSWRHWLASPLKRWFSAPYFQPIARIGSEGMAEWPLRPSNGDEPPVLGPDAEIGPAVPGGACQPVRANWVDVAVIRQRHGLQSRQVSTFVAPESGELFLYVNDAIFGSSILSGLLGFDGYDCLYRNNSGAAKITVERLGGEQDQVLSGPAPDAAGAGEGPAAAGNP